MRDEELHSEDIPFLRGGLQSGVRPRELGTAPLLWLSPSLSPHTLPILLSGLHLAWTLLFSKWCVLQVRDEGPIYSTPRSVFGR